ncbi:hypothetical protein SEVIR_5G393300v4 [Setaria viridis]|uniref:Uncharacterized protein n=1 Tax=Setaria viridis TaxID=4556 RepID=A0A4U6V282_SETVI|nr:uncharacterized protein LOC117855975 [Setaria viridis]TKW17817.1 hypothetical protein SEVIR_5G393300v2 [Setaria viridis]
MADSTAMTVDFLRARLLSERSVSRAAKERADELAKRVAELEEQVRAVTAQRRQAERAAAEVVAILESQGFGGHLSDDVADDSDSDQDGERQEDDAKGRGDTPSAPGEEEPVAVKGEAEDALSGTAQPGGLSWKGRSVSPRKATQLKHKHGRRYFYLLSSSDSSPKYRMGQSCRKNKRRIELMSNGSRSAAPEDNGGRAGSQKRRQDGSDCTEDGQADMGGEVGGDERSSGDGGGGQYVIRYEKDGEMERVLERQAELIGQYEEEEKAQWEWEKQYNENRNANKVDVEVKNKAYQTDAEANSSKNDLPITINPSAECLPNGSLSESPQNASQENGAQRREARDEPDNGRAQTPSVSAQESSTTSTVTKQDQDRGDLISDGDSGYNANTKHYAIKAPSEGSPSSDTLNSKVSDWSSSQFHDNTDSQADTHPYRPASTNIEDIESVLQALQRARISLSAKLSKPVPPNQVTLALPAPGDEHKEYDDTQTIDDSSNSFREELGTSSPARQEILALPAPEDYHERVGLLVHDTGISVAERLSSSSPRREEILALPAPGDDCRREIEDYRNIPVGAPGLFRLPTDSFPVDEKMFSASISFGTPVAAHGAARSAPSVPGDGSGIPAKQRYDLQAPALLSVPTPGRCNVPTPDFTVGSAPFLPGIPGLEQDLRRAGPLGNADLFMQRGIAYTISNKWML